MVSCVKAVGVSVLVLVVLGVVVGSITWAVLASQGPAPPELKPLDWWEHTIIYQIYPRSFKDSDGDGIGDIRGIIMELEHLADIGVGAIWMSPVFVSPMVDFGYDISDFYNIHSEYGTMQDFESLVQKAHELGIKVLLDYVPNHASTESNYFKKSEAREPGYENYFVWADPIIDPNNASNRLVPSNWISQFGGTVWEWNEARQQYYLHQFAIEQADFNFREKAVRDEMINIMRYWFNKGVDGYRLDAIPHLFEADPNDHGGVYPDEPLSGNMFLNPNQPGYTTQVYVRDRIELYDVVYEWRDFADNFKKDNGTETKILLAEAYANITMTMLYYGNEKDRHGAHFPFNFDFITSLSAQSNARDFVYVIQRWLTYMPAGRVANWVFGNHDQNRMPSRFRHNMVDGLNSLNMMLPGVAITYQGEEIGMRDGYVSWEDTVDVNACNQGNPDNYLDYSRDPARTPYQWDNTTNAGFSSSSKTWLPVAQDYVEINLQAQREAERSHYKVYKTMSNLRKEPTLSHGNYYAKALSEHTFVLVRHLITYDTFALVFNVGNELDIIDLSTVDFLTEPLTVHTSSIHSNRLPGQVA
ncbi:alpha amylase precursor [Danaus plexippus plexippus]|uniref:alpha-glucosidase n=1 Tax=Danaus plexippus plexippus TaxID=278856 RepID=A0A212F7X9_DANPL|nr:alpha amylase precursor [Danaus plexippus plexippus]